MEACETRAVFCARLCVRVNVCRARLPFLTYSRPGDRIAPFRAHREAKPHWGGTMQHQNRLHAYRMLALVAAGAALVLVTGSSTAMARTIYS